MKPFSATRRKSPSTGANTDCNKEKADNGKRRKTIFRQKQAGRLRIALSERSRRSGSGNGRRFSASRAAGNCQRNGIRSAPDRGYFSAAAQNVGNRNKTEKLHRLQNNFTKLALCGFAFLTGTSEITEDMQRMDEINRVRPYVAKTENRSTMTNCGSIGKRSLPTKSFRLKIWPTLRPKRRPRICKRP